MPRIATKGDTIAFRLPILLHDRLCRIAAEEGVSPKTVVERWAIEILEHTNRRGYAQNAKPFLGNYGDK